jgi:hypothetical protein
LIDIAERIEKVLALPKLRKVLCVLEGHNSDRSTPFLLAPQLFGIIHSVEGRKANLQAMPVLGRPPAELRRHFQDASAKARALARLVQKGPRPFVALAAHDEASEAFALLQSCPMIQSPNKRNVAVPLDWLLNDAAAALDEVARKICRTGHHRKPISKAKHAERLELKRLAVSRLVTAFRDKLNRPYHSHIATIVTVLTGIDTDTDYVKKIEKRRPRGAAARGQSP